MRIFIKTFGCTANRADSLKMKKILSACGHTFTDIPEDADLVVANTCTVTQTTQQKVLKFIRSISGSGQPLVVAGCLPSAQPEMLDGLPSVTPFSLDEIAKIAGDNGGRCEVPLLEGATGIVSISRGCTGQCSYCIVKQARGELHSRPVDEIVREIEALLEHGAREIHLTSQDASAYGLDTGKRLPDLLDAITGLDGDYMVRVGMMNPFTLIDIVYDVLSSMGDSHIFKFLHLPLQSGSNKVLEHMNRRHTVEDFIQIVQEFRGQFPDLTISTDFIVGYPTETEQDFSETLGLLNLIRPQKVNITRFSPRPSTPASLLPDLPDWKKKERSRVLTQAHHSINQQFFRSKIGGVARILTTEKGRGYSTIGRDIHYNNIVIPKELPLGHWYDVIITGSKTTYLFGEIS